MVQAVLFLLNVNEPWSRRPLLLYVSSICFVGVRAIPLAMHDLPHESAAASTLTAAQINRGAGTVNATVSLTVSY